MIWSGDLYWSLPSAHNVIFYFVAFLQRYRGWGNRKSIWRLHLRKMKESAGINNRERTALPKATPDYPTDPFAILESRTSVNRQSSFDFEVLKVPKGSVGYEISERIGIVSFCSWVQLWPSAYERIMNPRSDRTLHCIRALKNVDWRIWST